MEDKKLFGREAVSKKDYRARVKIAGQPVRTILLNTDDILYIKRNPWKLFVRQITMNRKYLYWNVQKSAYIISDDRPMGYQINPANLEKNILSMIDNIDAKATRAARSAPHIIHHGYMMHSIPLEPEEYQEDDEQTRFQLPGEFLFERKSIGKYQTYQELAKTGETPTTPSYEQEEEISEDV